MSTATTGWITLTERREAMVKSADEALIERCKAGEAEAWRLLIERHQHRVYHLAYQFAGNDVDADDLAQEVFIAVYKSLPSFRGESAFTTWLHRVAVNVCLNAQRGRPKAPPVSWEELEEGGLAEQLVSDLEDSPERTVLSEEAAALVRAKVAELPEHYRLAIILCDLQDVPYEEAARILKVRIGTIKSRVNRGRAMLKEKLADYFG